MNIFVGRNGAGKTNILEAISYLCLTKSFYATSDGTSLRIGADAFTVDGRLHSDGDVTYAVGGSYEASSKTKRFTVNKAPVERLSSMIGMFPLVVLSPENNAITFGTAGDRRRFMDLVLSQASRGYLEDLLEYRKILRQRNRLLLDGRMRRQERPEGLEAWSGPLVTRGARIIQKRAAFAAEFHPYVVRAFEVLTGSEEKPDVVYESAAMAGGHGDAAALEARLRELLAESAVEERRLGTTLVGPHRDELSLLINGLDLRRFASQGQHKTFLIGLKVAEFQYLREGCKETPVLLLDDVLSELDEERSRKLLELTPELGQTFVTTTETSAAMTAFAGNDHRRFSVNEGSVEHASD